jgi:hypothetical protein
MTPESCNLSICWAGLRWACCCGNTEDAAGGRWIVRTRFHSNEYDWRSNALDTESHRFLGYVCRNVFRSHGKEPPKHSNSEERDNSTVEGGDIHTVRTEPTSGRELTNRRQNTREYMAFTITFRMLSLFVVTKCYSSTKIVLQLSVVLPGEYPVNRFI